MYEDVDPHKTKEELESFLRHFNELETAVRSGSSKVDELTQQMNRAEPKVSALIVNILGKGQITVQRNSISYNDLISTALLNVDNPGRWFLTEYAGIVVHLINRAVGRIEAGLWPSKDPRPILKIGDRALRSRCIDLLAAPDKYDRVIREATTVLEDRIRKKAPHAVLSRLIPNSGDQHGENLVNNLFKPNDPVLEISSDKDKRVAFHKMLTGVFAYLRNESHHSLANEEWSWAWSIVGLIDHLIADVEGCKVLKDS